jgi:hypothetical protein
MALQDTPTPRSQPQILGEMLNGVTSRIGIRRLKVGNPILSILESVSLSTAKSTADAFRTLKAKDIDNATGVSLQRIGLDEKLPQLGPLAATTTVTITDTSFAKVSSNIYHGRPAPIVGSGSINVDKTTTFNTAATSGVIYIGRGTSRMEGPISYSNKVDHTTYWTLTLTTPTASFHNQGEEVVYAQGGDRNITVGQSVATPAGALSNSVQFSVILGGVIPDGEVTLENVLVKCSSAGSLGNVPENTITTFNGTPPFSGAAVTNPNRVTSGRDAETSQQYRDRIKTNRNTKTKGTDLAIKTAVINLTAEDEQKTILSTSLVRRHNKPSVLYIDDGNGYEPISTGVGYEVLRDPASGGEVEFKTINGPIVLAAVETLNTGPYAITTGSTLTVATGGNTETHIFDTTSFNNPNVATPYDVVDSINSDARLSFRARVSSNSSKVTIYPKDDSVTTIQVLSGTANDLLGFPTQKSYTSLLYKNDKLVFAGDYDLDRSTGSIELIEELAAEDRLTLGSLWSRGFLESAAVDTFTLSSSQALWFNLDGDLYKADSSQGRVSTLTVGIVRSLPSSFHVAISNTYNFNQEIKAGDSILLYRTSNNSLPAALEGVWKIIEVPSANTVVIELPCMVAARKMHAVANISNNRVLICGGLCANGSGILKSVDIYNASTGAWTVAPSMAYHRYGHTATTLSNGKVLVVGGMGKDGSPIKTAEIYDPSTNIWSNTTDLPAQKHLHSAVLLDSGNVLVAGGLTISGGLVVIPDNTSVEYNPTASTWGNATTFATSRYSLSMFATSTTQVMMVGGLTIPSDPYLEDTDETAGLAKFSFTQSVNKYNATSHLWSAAADLIGPSNAPAYRNYVGQLVDTDKVVAVADNKYWTYTISTNTWVSNGDLLQASDFAPSSESAYNGASSLNQPIASAGFSTLGRANQLVKTTSGAVVIPFAEYRNTSATDFKSFIHLLYSNTDSKWHRVGPATPATISGGRSFWAGTASPYNSAEFIVFGGQQGNEGSVLPPASYLQESAIASTVETINTNTNAASYLSPVVGTYTGIQGWCVYKTTKPTFKTTIGANSYSASTLASAIAISGLTATSYNNSYLRVSTNDAEGDIFLIGPTLKEIEQEALEVSSPNIRAYAATNNTDISNPFDFRLYQVGEANGSNLRIPCQQTAGSVNALAGSTIQDPQIVGGYLPLNGTICGLYKKNYWEDSLNIAPYNWTSRTQTADTSNDGRESGNFKHEIGRIAASTKEGKLFFDANNTIPDSSVVTTDITTTITPNQSIYCGTPFLFSPLEKLTVTVDNDIYTGRFSIPMSRKLKPYDDSFLSLITVVDAEHSNDSLSVQFGSNYDFSNFSVAMKARTKLGNILYRFYRPGAEGEDYVVRYEYPNAPSLPLSVNVDHTWKHSGTNKAGHIQKSHINVVLPSSTPFTGSTLTPTSRVLITEKNLNTAGPRLADLYIVVGYQVIEAERPDIAGSTRLKLQYCSSDIVTSGLQTGDFIRFDAVTPTPTTLQSGQTRITSVDAPIGSTQVIWIAAGSLDDGNHAMSLVTNPGVISVDPAAEAKVQFDSTIVTGDLVALNIPESDLTSFDLTQLTNQGFKISDCDATKLWLKVKARALTTYSFYYFDTLKDVSYISIFNSSSLTETNIVSSVNALANCPITAKLMGTSATISKATWDNESNWDAGNLLTDGYNAVLSTIIPAGGNTNYQLNLKRDTNTDLSTYCDWVNEEVYLMPAYARDVAKWLNTPCITGLWTMADVQTSNSGTAVQIMSKTVGKSSSVQVSGVGANQIAVPVIGSTSLVNNGIPSSYPNFIVNIDSANAAGFVGNSMVKITNEIPVQKQYLYSQVSALVTVNSIDKDGTFNFSSNAPFNAGAHMTTTGSIERVGNFAVIRLASSLATPNSNNHIMLPGDYIYLSSPKYTDGVFSSLLDDISTNNTGVFRIINISHNNTVIWIENNDAVTEKAVFNATFVTGDSVVPGDVLTVTSNDWGLSNKGDWTVLTVGEDPTTKEQFTESGLKLKVDATVKPIFNLASPQPMDRSSVQVSDGTPRTFYKKLLGVNPNSSNPNLTELVLCGNDCTAAPNYLRELNAISETAGSVISSMNKLDFPTDIKVGNDAYRYNTGLVGEAKKVLYGDDADPASYPGWVSNGASVIIDGCEIKRIQLGFSVRAIGNPDSAFADRIKSAIAGVINSNPVGHNLAISDLTTAGGGIDNVETITCMYQGDQIPVMAPEKTMVLNLNDITVIFRE